MQICLIVHLATFTRMLEKWMPHFLDPESQEFKVTNKFWLKKFFSGLPLWHLLHRWGRDDYISDGIFFLVLPFRVEDSFNSVLSVNVSVEIDRFICFGTNNSVLLWRFIITYVVKHSTYEINGLPLAVIDNYSDLHNTHSSVWQQWLTGWKFETRRCLKAWFCLVVI